MLTSRQYIEKDVQLEQFFGNSMYFKNGSSLPVLKHIRRCTYQKFLKIPWADCYCFFHAFLFHVIFFRLLEIENVIL